MLAGVWTRRRLLAAGVTSVAAAGLAGCRAPWTAPPDPDAHRLEDAAAGERTLIAAYGDVLRAHPELAPVLAPLRSDHRQHLAALTPHLSEDARRRAAGARRAPVDVADASAAREQLHRLEAAAQRERASGSLAARPEVAMLLASIAACEAAHADRLAAAQAAMP